MLTIANGFLLRNLPFTGSRGVSYPDYCDYQREAKSFEVLGAFSRFDVDVSDKVSQPGEYKGARLPVNVFSLIGQRPILGRDFVLEDALPTGPPVAILAFELWKSRYNKERTVSPLPTPASSAFPSRRPTEPRKKTPRPVRQALEYRSGPGTALHGT